MDQIVDRIGRVFDRLVRVIDEMHAKDPVDNDTEGPIEGFEYAHPLDILRWAGRTFGDGLVVTVSFGDATLVHLVSQAIPDAEIVLLDTGYLFAETTWYADELRTQFNLNLHVIQPSCDAVPNQWQTDTDGCCGARKVAPLQRALAGRTAWVTGLRRADSAARADAPIVHFDPFRDVTKVKPMARWTDGDVAQYGAMELLPDHPLTGRGYASSGCWPCTRAVTAGEGARAGRWAGTGKVEGGLHATPDTDAEPM